MPEWSATSVYYLCACRYLYFLCAFNLYQQQQGAQKEHGSRNDHVLLVTIRQKTLNSDTPFSSKEGRSASKTAISGIARQHGPGEARKHQSTQVRCDTRLGTNLHRTVARQSRKINPEILDDGTYPISQDFFHLPARTTWYNATARLVYL
jgi:hypothetical protein